MSGTCFECKFMRQRTDLEPCEHCTNVFAMTGVHPSFQSRKPITNADRIRSMTDEELAKTMSSTGECPPRECPYAYADLSESGGNITDKQCVECWLDWLKQEVSE